MGSVPANIFSGIERYLAILAAMCRDSTAGSPKQTRKAWGFNASAAAQASAFAKALRRTSWRTRRRNDAKRTWLLPSSFRLFTCPVSPSLQNVKEQARAPYKAHITTI